MPIDINWVRTDKGGNPGTTLLDTDIFRAQQALLSTVAHKRHIADQWREYQTKRFEKPEVVDTVLALDEVRWAATLRLFSESHRAW